MCIWSQVGKTMCHCYFVARVFCPRLVKPCAIVYFVSTLLFCEKLMQNLCNWCINLVAKPIFVYSIICLSKIKKNYCSEYTANGGSHLGRQIHVSSNGVLDAYVCVCVCEGAFVNGSLWAPMTTWIKLTHQSPGDFATTWVPKP